MRPICLKVNSIMDALSKLLALPWLGYVVCEVQVLGDNTQQLRTHPDMSKREGTLAVETSVQG
jgi:hypothetical protein